MEMRSALIVGVGQRPERLAGAAVRDATGCRWRWRRATRTGLPHWRGETAAATFACEAAEPEEVGGLFDAVIATQGVPDVVVYNASARARGPVAELDPEAVARAIAVSAYARLPGRPAGGASHAAARLGRDPVHRRVGQR